MTGGGESDVNTALSYAADSRSGPTTPMTW